MTPPTERHLTAMGRQASEIIVGAIERDRRRVITDLVVLTKPRVVVMVLVTTLVGYYVALPGAADWTRVLHLVVGTMLAAGGTLALNQYIERDVDARMARTRLRPLPDGRLMPLEALLFGSALTGLGLVYLAACVNVRAALVTTVVVWLYLFAYTPLKLRTPLSTLVGAVPGALPPVTGWVAARDDVGLGAAVLFGILFLWQLPHTLAIARLYREDYARAGVLVLPVVDEAGASTERQIMTGVLGRLVVRRVNGRVPPPEPPTGGGDDDDRDPPRRGLENAPLATMFLIAGEVMFFAGLISAYLVLRMGAAQWPPPLQPRLPLLVTGLNTLVLLGSSFAMVRALRDRRDRGLLVRGLTLTGVLGITFLAVQGYEWIRLVSYGLTVTSGAYGATFYTLIGIHGVHVLGALAWLAVVLAGVRRGRFVAAPAAALRACGMY